MVNDVPGLSTKLWGRSNGPISRRPALTRPAVLLEGAQIIWSKSAQDQTGVTRRNIR